MKKYHSSELDIHQSSVNRSVKPFLMKPAIEAKSFPCTEFNFDQTLECPRVIRLQDYLIGLEELTEEQAYKLTGNQPIFYLQERFAENGDGYDWNGFILFRFQDKMEARKVAIEHAEDLSVALAFDSPLDNRYYILVKTGAEKFDEKSRLHYCYKHKALLQQYLPNPKWMDLDYYVRAFTSDHYDVVNKDLLFGESVDICPAADAEGQRCCNAMTVSEVLKSFFSHLFRRSA